MVSTVIPFSVYTNIPLVVIASRVVCFCLKVAASATLSSLRIAVSCNEVFAIVTNKDAHGKKGALVAIIEGVRSADITEFCDECGHDFIP